MCPDYPVFRGRGRMDLIDRRCQDYPGSGVEYIFGGAWK